MMDCRAMSLRWTQPLPRSLSQRVQPPVLYTSRQHVRVIASAQPQTSAESQGHSNGSSPRSLPTTHTPIRLVSFYVPAVAGGGALGPDEVLATSTLRTSLKPQQSPFIGNSALGGAMVHDEDVVALNTLHLSSDRSAGAEDMCFFMADEPRETPSATPTTVAPGGTSSDGSTVPPLADTISISGTRQHGVRQTRVRNQADVNIIRECIRLPPWAPRAGPRETIYFDPKTVNAAVVTCGGLCPGLNDVVQGLVHRLCDYGVPEGNVIGIRYGLRGFTAHEHRPIILNRQAVANKHLRGGTLLGTSRGGADIPAIVHRIGMWNLDMLFVVGGDGGNRAAEAIRKECDRQGVICCVVGVPKSIDNVRRHCGELMDILLIDETFGYETAVQEAQTALAAAKVEAESALHGIGLVKLMGRSSGALAMQASMASAAVDACIIPEVPFSRPGNCLAAGLKNVHHDFYAHTDTHLCIRLDGERGLMAYIKGVMDVKGHAVVCVAEGAGQDLLHAAAQEKPQFDPSGNPVLQDVGTYLKKEFKNYFPQADIKYIDPTYMIRAIPSTSTDHILCKILAYSAVDAAFSGYTGITVGKVNTHFALLPIDVITRAPRLVDPCGKKWNRLCASTGQPFAFM